VALGLQVLGDVLQSWVTDPSISSEIYSAESTLGFYLGYLSFLLLAVGMVLTGISAVRAGDRSRWYALPLITGLLVMPTVVFPLLGFSNGTLEWDLMYTAGRVPLGLCLALIGTVLWSGTAAPGDRTPPRARRA
jgi:ABC-type tungstate transport system substrate-binding protein